ncbi:MAG: FecR domain-containing protein [Gammaproteobacteria bacterium]
MTITFRSFSKLLFILLLSLQFTNAMANTGKAFSIKGTAVINESELRAGDTIKEGDIIKTGANSSVKIIMKDRTVLDINENTRFEITKYSYSKEAPAKNKSSFRLLKGAFRYISGLIARLDIRMYRFLPERQPSVYVEASIRFRLMAPPSVWIPQLAQRSLH